MVCLQIILLFMGIRKWFWSSTRKEDVISALATLAFEGRREALFSRQLMAALEIIENGHLPVGSV